MNLNKRIEGFIKLGNEIRKISGKENAGYEIDQTTEVLGKLIYDSVNFNGWFTSENVALIIGEIGKSLSVESLKKWLEPNRPKVEKIGNPKKIGVVMAGNIPAVGFNDFLSVLITGNQILAKLSSDDNKILPAIANLLISIEPEFEPRITFTEEPLKNFDAIIATGNNNSARYFEYYFGKYPHIIRKNRNGIAVLNGNETKAELESLANDIFLYFGLGCRNVSKIFVPKNYDFSTLLRILSSRKKLVENNKYFNNYEYNKAIYLINGVKHFDTGNLLLIEDEHFSSPVSVLYYSFYENKNVLSDLLEIEKNKIQCIVSSQQFMNNTVPFGKSQQPNLWDYADQVDVIDFLLNI